MAFGLLFRYFGTNHSIWQLTGRAVAFYGYTEPPTGKSLRDAASENRYQIDMT